MLKITFNREVVRIPQLVRLIPNAPYYVTPNLLRKLRDFERKTGDTITATVERHEPPIKRWNGEDLNGKRVGFLYAGYLGDNLALTAVVEQLHMDYPTAEIHVYAEEPNTAVWSYQRSIAGRQARPFQFAIAEAELLSHDSWIIPRPLPYLRKTSPRNYYDLLEEAVGITIQHKRPHVMIPGEVRALLREEFAIRFGHVCFVDGKPAPAGQILDMPYIYVQTTASHPSRTPGYGDGGYWYERLQALQTALPGYWFFLAGNIEMLPGFAERYKAAPLRSVNAYYLNERKQLPLLYSFEMMRGAALVISPDSMALHGAAAFDKPTVALWQTRKVRRDRIPRPDTRISTYPKATSLPIWTDPEILTQTVRIMTSAYSIARD